MVRLESVRTMMGANEGDDPLDNEEQLQDQMDSLPYMCRLQYSRSATYLSSLADPIISALQSRLQAGAASHAPSLLSMLHLAGVLITIGLSCHLSFERVAFGRGAVHK